MTKAVIYLRVSTGEQNTEGSGEARRQLVELYPNRLFGERHHSHLVRLLRLFAEADMCLQLLETGQKTTILGVKQEYNKGVAKGLKL